MNVDFPAITVDKLLWGFTPGDVLHFLSNVSTDFSSTIFRDPNIEC
jgi:hypothetical protein